VNRSVIAPLWTAVLAALVTAIVSGVWAALLLANLRVGPAIPWSAAAMALLLWALWSFLGGRWGPARSRDERRRLLRAGPLSPRIMIWAVVAGVTWIVFLAGFWIVLHQLVATAPNRLPDFSKTPMVMLIATLIMASIAGAVSEEAGFRGYFQGTLERQGLGAFSILASALLMAPEHAVTQGFVWPTLLFYLLVDAMLGALAYITKSIRPGIVVHAVGLFVFFGLIWPHDKDRGVIWRHGADLWFWIHAGQIVVFAVLSGVAFVHLARLARSGTPELRAHSPAP
jgi:membrane protease YdiL (CAAX protease family)